MNTCTFGNIINSNEIEIFVSGKNKTKTKITNIEVLFKNNNYNNYNNSTYTNRRNINNINIRNNNENNIFKYTGYYRKYKNKK